MRVGLVVMGGYPWEANAAALDLGERLQLDSYWLPDHFIGAFHPDIWRRLTIGANGDSPDNFFDPWCLAPLIGRMTDRPIGIGVTDASRRRAPDVARAAITLQHLCEGGFNLGVGSGEAQNLVPFGYPYDRPVSVCEAFLADLRCLLDTGTMPSGGVGRLGLPLESEHGRPRVWLAAHGPRMLHLAGRYADGWLPSWVSAEEYGEKLEVIQQHAAKAGRQRLEAGYLNFVLLGESRDHIAELVEREPLAKLLTLFAHGSLWARHGIEHPLGSASRGMIDVVAHAFEVEELLELAPRIPFELLADYVLMGTAADVTESLSRYASAGCEHVVLANITGLAGGPAEGMAQLPEMARLRAMLAAL